MKESLRKLKTKKIIISAIIVLLLFFMVGLLTILKPSIKNIKISKVLTNTKTLSASVIDGVSEEITSNNYDEIKYKLEVNKDDLDTAVITGTLSDKENKYARFKKTSDSEVSDDGKTITVTTAKNKVTITVIVENAPYGITFKPNFNINSEDESKSKINVEPVTITGKSVEGTVLDENGTIYTGIELSLFKNGEEIKKTYSKEDGKYVFSLGNLDSYEIKLAETKYKLVRYTEETTDQNRRILNLVIKEVEPFTLNISKTISRLDLVINGKKESFNYNDETKVLKSIKNAKTIEGSIYYNIYLKNDGEVKGTISTIQDVIPEGLSFDESKNPGWTKEDNNLFYTPLEGTELDAFEKTSATLVLDIVKTDEAKTYINTAIAHGDDYKYVVYYLNGNIYKELYVINSEKIQNINPNIENFAGWYTDRNYTNKYNFSNEATKDLALYGKIENKKYNVTFIDKNPNNNVETVLAIVEVPEGESVNLIDHPEYNGYTFECFSLYDSCYDNDPITGDTVIYTSYTINNYDIEYDLDDGVVAVANPTSYTVKDSFTLNNPTKEGFTFVGWTGTDLTNTTKTVTIPEGSTGKKTYTAHYEINRSTLTVNPNGGTYEDNASIVTFTEDYGTLKVLSESVRRGYNFRRYDHIGGGTYQNLTYLFDNDDATLTAVYEIINYSITYENITDAERTTLNNKVEYNVETDTFTLNNPSTRLDDQGNNYQDFLGWDDGNGNVSLTVTIPKGSIGDRTYTAVWRENEDDYGITYELHGGSYEEGKSNPSTYTRQTNTFTLNNPSKNGYTFLGWTGTGLSSATETVTIIKGSAGDRAYEANYQVIPYEIRYHGLNSSEEAALNNPTGYNIESNSITLANPTRTGYEFIGWSGTDITDKSTSVIIPIGSTGNREYTANFRELEYSLTYTLNGGDYETGKSNPDKYTIESDPITLNNPSKTGYTFKGWSGTDLTGNENTLVTIPTGSIGHRSFLANYTPIIYNILYDYNGGNLPAGVTNPDRYTIESDEITFNVPEKEGYSFLHYKEGNNIITNIPTGSIGDKSLKAYYQINKYNVVYHNEDIVYTTDEVDWNNETSAPSENPTKAHGIFLYWSEDGVNPFDFSTKITSNKDLYAVYEMVIEPVITYTPTLDEITNRTWVCSNSSNDECGDTVTITSGKDDPEYTLYYKIGDGEAVEYTGPFKVYENTTITAFAKKNNIYSPENTKDIVNVDAIAPTINNPGTGAMSFNMSISGTAQDAESGVKQFTLYVKEKNAIVYDDTFTYTSEVFDGINDHAENYDHTFYGVQDNTEYIVKIVAEDYVGNISEKEVEVKTHPYVARVVGKNGILWYTVDPDTKEFVLEDGKEFLLFDSIQSAVDYCAEIQCTIQTNPIMPVVNESVTVGSNQNITIDLDGRSITSAENATFINNGNLQIVDRNPRMNGAEHDSIGKVINTANKTIVNNGIFILGDGSSEPSESFIYPELDRPIIEGYQTAIEQNNIFHFYDGKLVSDTITMLDNGEEPITQYSYNVAITNEGEKKIGTLAIVDDPEARIKSTYYTKLKVSPGDNAFDSTKKGTISSESAKLLSKIRQAGEYGFIYDEINDEIYNGNKSTFGTSALSYLKIDLTDYTEGQYITFDAIADTFSANDYGYVSVSEELNDTGTQIVRLTGNDRTTNRVYYLEKGKVYYVFFGFVKTTQENSPSNGIKIYNFRLLGDRSETTDVTLFEDYDNSSFVKQDDGSFINSNIGLNWSIAHSYLIYDLRDATEDIDLYVSSDYLLNGSGHAWIYLSNNDSYQSYDSNPGLVAHYIGYSSSEDKTSIIKLKHGEINYVHFCFYNYYSFQVSNAYFKINSISLSKPKTENVELISELQHNSDDSYYFVSENPLVWKDASNYNRDFRLNYVYHNSSTNSFDFRGNGYGILENSDYDLTDYEESVYVEYSTTNSSNSILYMGSNKERISIGKYGNNILVSNNTSVETYTVPSTYSDGNKHSFLVTYKDGVYRLFYDGVELSTSSDRDYYSGSNANTYIGSRSNAYYFVGSIYSVKVFNKELVPEELNNTENLVLNLDGRNGTVPLDDIYVSNNQNTTSTIAHSYLAFDLTNVNEDRYLYVNTSISAADNDYGYVQVTDSNVIPTNDFGRAIYLSGVHDNVSGVLILKKNRINYVHFIYNKDSWKTEGTDTFTIKEIKYCDSIENAYSMSSNNFSKIDSMFFEKPILNDEVDTVQILKNISLDTAIVVPEEKEVILDLNGYTLTSSIDDYIIKNNGKLSIIDSEYSNRHEQNVNYITEQSRLLEEAKSKYLADVAEYKEYAGLCDGCEPSDEYEFDYLMVTDYSYTGNYDEFNVPSTGNYRIEAWGAQGEKFGGWNVEAGKGAYVKGDIHLTKDETLYIYVGGVGSEFNGGGRRTNQYSNGSGATDVRLVSGPWSNSESLASRIIVAGSGGAGFTNASGIGGAGGALKGIDGWNGSYGDHGGKGGTQTSGGEGGTGGHSNGANGAFGRGANGTSYSSGGGSGYYGGGSSGVDTNEGGGGGGGSSYISGYKGCVAISALNDLTPRLDSNNAQCTEESALEDITCSYHYSGKIFTNTVMKSGIEEMPSYSNESTVTGNTGDGHVRIQRILTEEERDEMTQGMKRYNVKTMPVYQDYLANIDISSSIDISTLTPDDEVTFNPKLNDEYSGSLTSTIHDIVLNEQYASLTLDGCSINVNANNKNGIVNRGLLTITGNSEVNANNGNTVGIYNETNGSIIANSGVINAKGSNSIGLLSRSNAPVDGARIVTTSNSTGLRSEAIGNIAYSNLNISGDGVGFSDFNTTNSSIINSSIKSTSTYSYILNTTSIPGNVTINNSNFYGTFQINYSPKIVAISNSNLSNITNTFGYIIVNSSNLNNIDNGGDAFINNSTVSGTGTLIWNHFDDSGGGPQNASNMYLNNLVINSTDTGSVEVIRNYDNLTVTDTKINNINNNTNATAFTNFKTTSGYVYGESISHLNITGNTSIDSTFGTAINNTGILTIGSDDKSIGTKYLYSYTGHQEEFVAPADGEYKLETWGAAGGDHFSWGAGWGATFRGGQGAYASGTITLHEGDKLYIHVGGYGSGYVWDVRSLYGTYNGGGYSASGLTNGMNGSGGGATDISLSNEDNVWSYDNGIYSSKRSQASYEQRILVAGGGGAYKDNNGGLDFDTSTANLGYGGQYSGGGYYGGINSSGGSSYASDSLTDVVLIPGNQDMPAYITGLMHGNTSFGFAKITQLTNSNDTVLNEPTISATNYGITGNGTVYYYDGIINASNALNTDIKKVADNYDIYKSLDGNDKENFVLLPNADSRPVPDGAESYVAAIGNAKYTTIQNAVDSSNNGDEIDLLVDIDQQNTIIIPQDKQITIDYNGHTVISHNASYLFDNHGYLVIKDSTNTLPKNTYYGDFYINNDGTLSIDNLYITEGAYALGILVNDGSVSLNNSKFEFGSNVSEKTGFTNSANGTMTFTNNNMTVRNSNTMINSEGSIDLSGNTISLGGRYSRFLYTTGTSTLLSNNITNSSSNYIVYNDLDGETIIDNNIYIVSGDDVYGGRYLLRNHGKEATIKNTNTTINSVYNEGKLTLENNNIPSGTLESTGILIIKNGVYANAFNISGEGKRIDDTDSLYSFIMKDGTINTSINLSSTGITNIESGAINSSNESAINNSGKCVINLGIHDGNVDSKTNTKPVITGNEYGINTSSAALVVNFYDGIITGNKAFNVTINELETGYAIKREVSNNRETKYLTNEPMFINANNSNTYNTISELNTALSNGSVNNNDIIRPYRDITISKEDESIVIPSGLKITFDINNKVIEKSNSQMFINNGELDIVDSVSNSESLIDSYYGDIFTNNGTLNVISGKYTSENSSIESNIIKNNENATVTVTGGTFTKYYDKLDYRQSNSGSIINNSGTSSVTGGNFYVNGSFVEGFYQRVNGSSDYIYASSIFVNNEGGNLNVTGGSYSGISGKTWSDYYSDFRTYSTPNKGQLIYNYGTVTLSNLDVDVSQIGYNSGTLTLDDITMSDIVSINSTGGSHPNFINTGVVTISDSEFTIHVSFLDNIGGTANIIGTTIDRPDNGVVYRYDFDSNAGNLPPGYKNSQILGNYNSDNGIVNINNSTLSNKGSGEVLYNTATINIKDSTLEALSNVTINEFGTLNIDSSSVTTSSGSAIYASTATVNIKGNSSVVSNNGVGINLLNTPLTIGESIEIDEGVSQTYPLIKGTTYAINNSGTINFYDGLLEGKTNAVSGIINVIESGYGLINGTDNDYKTNYLDRIQIVKNVTQSTTSNEVKYYDLKTAFDEANNGDTLQMIANYSNLVNDETAVNNHNVTFDLNGKFIKQSNNLLITNNATLNLIDSSQDKSGQIIGINGEKIIENNGTINFTSGKITSDIIQLFIKNNAGSSTVIKDNAKLESNEVTTLIDNYGTLEIYNGAYLQTHGGVHHALGGENTGKPMVINRNTLIVSDLNVDDDPNTSSSLNAPWFRCIDSSWPGGSFFGESAYYDSAIRNTVDGTVTIYGGIYNNGDTTNPDPGKILWNAGTATLKNMDNYSFSIGYNSGTLIIEDSYFHNFQAGALMSPAGTLTIKDTTINIYATQFSGFFGDNTHSMYIANADLDNVTFTGGVTTGTLHGIEIVGPSEIKNSSIDIVANSRVLYNYSTLTIKNTPINVNQPIQNDGTLTIDNCNITSSSAGMVNNGTVTFTNGSTITASGGNGINNTGGVLDINKTTSIISTSTDSDKGIGINATGGLVTIGDIGGAPDTTDPYIEGIRYGLFIDPNTKPDLYFYDGLIVGQQGPNAISGSVKAVEGGYIPYDTTVTDPDSGIVKHNEYLVVNASSVAIAKVGTVKFTTNSWTNSGQALQLAIDYAIGDGTNVQTVDLIADVDLINDEISVVASEPITINTNGFNIYRDSTYTLSSNITLNGNSVGGNITKALADIFDLSYNAKNIIIYELSDGSSLDSLKTYKLYKDDELVSLAKEELGRYSYKGKNEELIPIKGRLYIDNLSKGSYRLISNDNKSIEFSIDADGNITGNVAENPSDSNKVNPKSVAKAELTLTHQTGNTRYYYYLAIIPLLLLIFMLFIMTKKYKERND